jgi:hypothetical protein
MRVDSRFADAKTLFYVIGAQKAGTTWLADFMRQHPEIATPAWKEHNYWNMVEGQPDPGRLLMRQAELRENDNLWRQLTRDVGLSWGAKKQRAITNALRAAESPRSPHTAYADVLFALARQKTKAVGEICPQYALLRSETFGQMNQMSQNARFVYILRDPVERLISGARHFLSKARDRNSLTTEALTNSVLSIVSDPESLGQANSRYDHVIDRLEAAVPSTQVAYFFYETFFQQAEIDRLCIFLGVTPKTAQTEKKVHLGAKKDINVDASVRAEAARCLAPVYSAMRAKFGDAVPDQWARSEALGADFNSG